MISMYDQIWHKYNIAPVFQNGARSDHTLAVGPLIHILFSRISTILNHSKFAMNWGAMQSPHAKLRSGRLINYENSSHWMLNMNSRNNTAFQKRKGTCFKF